MVGLMLERELEVQLSLTLFARLQGFLGFEEKRSSALVDGLDTLTFLDERLVRTKPKASASQGGIVLPTLLRVSQHSVRLGPATEDLRGSLHFRRRRLIVRVKLQREGMKRDTNLIGAGLRANAEKRVVVEEVEAVGHRRMIPPIGEIGARDQDSR